MDFNNLQFKQPALVEGFKKAISAEQWKKEVLVEPIPHKLDFGKDILNKRPKLTKDQLKLVEPGHKMPVASFLQMGKHCDECNDVVAHAHDPISKKIICLKCKTIKQY
jgi:hypothetical protein